MALPQIVLFGDSLTQWSFDETRRGFGWALQRAYEGKAEVLNKGVAGYTSTWLKPQFANIIAEAKQRYECGISTLSITIFLGANDACLPLTSAHVPLDKFEDNLREYVNDILAEESLDKAKVILIAPPPINIPKSLSAPLDFSSSRAPDDDIEVQKQS